MKKKVLLVCSLVVLLLSACSSNESSSTSSINSPNQQQATTTTPSSSPAPAPNKATSENDAELEVIDGDLVGVEGFDSDVIDPQDIDSFIGAAGFGMKEAVLQYIKADVDIDAVNDFGANALSTAIIYEELEIVKLLLDNGANINYQNKAYNTALISATDSGLTNMVKFLLENGADPNIGGGENQDYYPIISAAFLGHTDIVKLLLAHGAHPNMAYEYMGEVVDASWIAEDHGFTEIVKLIESAE
ncbi:hypothetical protein PAECIP111893_02350 [Paenibacillus plantiphilus]|uniref:Ankyrin repeat-containing protein n=1 Tax=Paenibacillus plantiphilus TaxID=2905650 RepID=A0ABM9C6N7_9BACL|nr:ankyrin repeat domain-containing protein [Paenibacillus plantiphilus]CAH1205447.1 hypothetical protein PAECIP111893_02350 [Paenibacillus plantiphilus]